MITRLDDWRSAKGGWVNHTLVLLCCGLWVGTWIHTLAQLGAIQHAFFYDLSIALFMAVRLIPIPWLRTVATMLFGAASAYSLSISASGNSLPFPQWWRTIEHSILWLLTQHTPSPVLSALVFALIFPALFGLVLYSSHYGSLWLFYQGLALFAMTAVGAATRIPVTGALAILLGVAAFGLFVQMHEKIGLFEWRGWRITMMNTLPALAFIVAMLCMAALLPKPLSAWHPWLNALRHPLSAQNRTVSTSPNPARFNRVGFQSGPQTLGGGVQTNAIPVLSLLANGPTYLRGQVMATYTGHAWQSSVNEQASPVRRGTVVPISPTATFHALPAVTSSEQIEILGGGLHTRVLFGSYKVTSVQTVGNAFAVASVNASNDTWEADRPLAAGQTYTVTSQTLVSPYTYLSRQTQPFTQRTARDLASSFAPYIALPLNFPTRDQQLAAAITESGRTEYQKVQLLSQYLKNHEHYAIRNIPVPGPSQDYVDEFIFETHRGYCNNFSTALAVLLRSVGIPTRWVTGFNVGSLDATYSGPVHRYVVRDSDAHSWVEVYFPQAGWIPFDATPGFQMPFGTTGARTSGILPNGTGGTAPSRTTPRPPAVQQGGHGQNHPPHPPTHLTQSNPGSVSQRFLGISLGNQRAFWLRLAGIALLVLAFSWIWRRMGARSRSVPLRRKSSDNSFRQQPLSADHSVSVLVAEFVEQLRHAAGLPVGATLRQVLSHFSGEGTASKEEKLFVGFVERLWYSAEPLNADDEEQIKEFIARWDSHRLAPTSARRERN